MLHLSRGSRPKEEVPAKLSQREVQSLGVKDNGTVCATAKQTLAREGLTGIKTPDRAKRKSYSTAITLTAYLKEITIIYPETRKEHI